MMALERGRYDIMLVCITSLAIQTIDFDSFGQTAHASAAPWDEQSALERFWFLSTESGLASTPNDGFKWQTLKGLHRLRENHA